MTGFNAITVCHSRAVSSFEDLRFRLGVINVVKYWLYLTYDMMGTKNVAYSNDWANEWLGKMIYYWMAWR